jgi:hypothetical protein
MNPSLHKKYILIRVYNNKKEKESKLQGTQHRQNKVVMKEDTRFDSINKMLKKNI